MLEIHKLIKEIKENENIEFKKCENKLPSSFWETYSSFSNTLGGIIILGISEGENGNDITGVLEPEKIIKDLWTTLSNKSKVSFSSLTNEDIRILEIEKKSIIVVNVKEVSADKKPVYINNNYKNIYIRKGEADIKVSEEEYRNLVIDAVPKILLLDKFSIEDLDLSTVRDFKFEVDKRYPTKNYKDLSEEEFLKEIGAIRLDREDNNYKITDGCLLFLGKNNSITDFYSKFYLDYFYRGEENERWIDRVSSSEPQIREMNIYNFYKIVFEKIKNNLKNNFSLNENTTRENKIEYIEIAAREALANALIHANYLADFPKVKIEMFDGYINFLNSGKMLVTEEQYLQGGYSVIRNEVLVKLAMLCGIVERQGFGGVNIYKSAEKLSYKTPEITTNILETTLKLWTVDVLHSRKDLTEEEKKIYSILLRTKNSLSKNELIKKSQLNDYLIRKSLVSLINKELIISMGAGRATKYEIKVGTQGYFAKIQTQLQNLVKLNSQTLNDNIKNK